MTNKMEDDNSMATEAPLAPITSQRKIRNDLENSLPKPYLARALVAVDTDHPNGTCHKNHGMSVLQQHVTYFDQNNDGVVYPWETYAGFRAIGLNAILSLILAFGFNAINSYPTLPGWIPSILFPVYIKNIHKAKHGSDTGVYDTEGRFMPVNLENMFSKYAISDPEKMKFKELWNMTEGNRVAYDLIGLIEAKVSWTVFYLMAKDEDGYVSKESTRQLFDGTLFQNLANKNQKRIQKKNKKMKMDESKS